MELRRLFGHAFFSNPAAKRAARDFAELVGEIVNATVSHAPVTLVEIQASEPTWLVTHAPGGLQPEPLRLVNGEFLFLYQRLCIRRGGRHLATMEYQYWHQSTAKEDSWITRWEFVREPPPGYGYPQSHIHVNATPGFYRGRKPYPDLHLPTGHRVTIEGVLEHLVREHQIGPISENWESILARAKEEFREIQQRRIKVVG